MTASRSQAAQRRTRQRRTHRPELTGLEDRRLMALSGFALVGDPANDPAPVDGSIQSAETTGTDPVIMGSLAPMVTPSVTTSQFIITYSVPFTKPAGTTFPVNVAARDAFGNLATNANGPLLVTSDDPQAVLPTTVTLVNGVATFDVTLKTAGRIGVTVADPAENVSAGTGVITVAPSVAASLTLTGPTSATAGQTTPFTVTARDAFGNVAPDFSGPVAITSTDPQAVLPTDVTLASGTATFNVTPKTAGTVGITATDPAGVLPAITASTDVAPGPVAFLQLVGPFLLPANQATVYTVTAFDAFNNQATNSSEVLTLTGSDAGVSIPPTLTLANGVGTFAVTYTTGGPHTITVASSSDPTVTKTLDVVATTTVTGTVFIDLSGTGVRLAADPLLPERTVYLDLNGNGQLDSNEPTATTDNAGRYSLTNETATTPTVRQALDRDPSLRDSRSVARTNADGSVDFAVSVLAPVAPVAATPGLLPASPSTDPTTAYVAALYRSVLGRNGSAAEITTWLGLIADRSLNRGDIASMFVGSVENRQREVAAFYQQFLGRAPDASSSFWVDALRAGATEAQVARSILDSPEFNQPRPSLELLIGSLYNDVLGRKIDDGPPQTYPTLVPDAETIAIQTARFVDSAEAHDQVVASFYAAFLHRQREDGASARVWTDGLDSGTDSATDVAIGILASDEFLANALAGIS